MLAVTAGLNLSLANCSIKAVIFGESFSPVLDRMSSDME